jgi:hypothetical protein
METGLRVRGIAITPPVCFFSASSRHRSFSVFGAEFGYVVGEREEDWGGKRKGR